MCIGYTHYELTNHLGNVLDTNNKVQIEYTTQTHLSKILNPETGFEKENPGITAEVEYHKKGHRDRHDLIMNSKDYSIKGVDSKEIKGRRNG